MAAATSITNNFHTTNYKLFQQRIGALCATNVMVKSWEIFNRCIREPLNERRHTSTVDFVFMNLPADNRALQQFLREAADREMPELAGAASPEGAQLTEKQILQEILALPSESEQRKTAVEAALNSSEIQDLKVQDPEAAERVAAFLAPRNNAPLSKQALMEKESSILAKLFLLPYESKMAQDALRRYRASFEAEVPQRLQKFQAECEKIFSPDPADYPGGDNPLEHKTTLIFAARARLDLLMSITYHRVFEKPEPSEEGIKSQLKISQ